MRTMKDSGIEWIGDIPADWNIKRIKAVLCERNESNNPIQTDEILSLTNDRGVIPYKEKGDVGNKSKEDLTGYKLAYPGDIVLNSMNVFIGSVGLSSYFGCVSPVYYMLYPRNKNDSVSFFNYLFQTKELQTKLHGYGNGIMEIRMRIQMSKLNSVQLPVPPSNVQHKIAAYLDRKCSQIDAIIARQKEVIEKLKAYKLSVITEAVTKGLNPNVPMKDSGIDFIGSIPETWRICRLRNIGTLQNGISKGGEFFGHGFPFVSYGDVYRNFSLPVQVAGLIDSSDEERRNYSVESGDIFFTRTSETIEEVGFSSVCEETIPDATFAGFLIRVRPFTDDLESRFAKYYFRSNRHRYYLVKQMNLVTRASLGQDLLKSMPVLVPPKEEQIRIAKYLDKKCNAIETSIAYKQKIVDRLTAYKKSLIYEVVTGKKEVKR